MEKRQNEGVLAQRKEALEEKAEAMAESRQLKMELEKERGALQQAEANCAFLVRETSRSRRRVVVGFVVPWCAGSVRSS